MWIFIAHMLLIEVEPIFFSKEFGKFRRRLISKKDYFLMMDKNYYLLKSYPKIKLESNKVHFNDNNKIIIKRKKKERKTIHMQFSRVDFKISFFFFSPPLPPRHFDKISFVSNSKVNLLIIPSR